MLHTLADLYKICKEDKWQGSLHQSHDIFLNAKNIISLLDNCNLLLDQAGIVFGERVVVKLTNTINSIVLLICLWSRGAVVIPRGMTTADKNLRGIFQDCQAAWLISVEEILSIEKINSNAVEFTSAFKLKSPQRVSGSDLALIIYTSGSTGNSKGIQLTHNNIISALNSISDYLELSATDKILCLSPLTFDYGLYQVLFAFNTACATYLFQASANPLNIAKAIKRDEITVLPVLPVIAIGLAKTIHLIPDHFSSLKKITNTGGHLPESTITSLHNTLPHVSIYAMYGLTEAKRVLYLSPGDSRRKLGSVGLPMPGLEAKIFRQCAQDEEIVYIETEPYETGVLFVRGPSIMQSYTNTLTDENVYFVSGKYRDDLWLCTGDLFYRDIEGYFYFNGRQKELIKQAGFCLYPQEIENTVATNAGIEFASVLGELEQDGNEVAHLYIVLCEDTEFNREQTLTWLHNNIEKNYLPKQVSFINDIPVNENGKFDKKSLL